jgi:hypothetical protein
MKLTDSFDGIQRTCRTKSATNHDAKDENRYLYIPKEHILPHLSFPFMWEHTKLEAPWL